VGLVPAFIETLWLGPARVRVAKLVGSDFTLHLCNLPVLPDALARATSRALHYFLKEHRCDLLLFGPLSGPRTPIDEFLAVGRQESEVVESAEALGDSCHTYWHLPDSFDDYLKSLGKQHRDNLKRKLSQFSKAHAAAFDVVSDPDGVSAEFEKFLLLHAAQWRTEGKLGHFGDWPHAEDFNRDVVHCLGAQGMVRFHRILAGDQVVSSQYSFVFGGTTYWRLPARVCAAEFDRYSFGMTGLAKLFEASIGEGRHTIEGGRGHYGYKLQLGGREWPLRTVQFVRRGRGVAARVRCFRAFASLLNLAYYRVLFARIAPRVPALQGSLWPSWIRSSW
jgi:CelD/BcsL family acetyltransferase involved in cellulose biosynthesis